MKKYLLSSLLLALALPMSAQLTQRVSGGNINDPGLTYTLPQTALEVTVEAQCTQRKAGPFAQFAERYLGITDAPQEDATVWTVRSISVLPVAVADTSKRFHVNFSAPQTPALHLTDDGRLWGINMQPEPQTAVAEPEETEPEQKNRLSPVSVMNEEMLKAGSKNKQAEIAARQIFRIRESRLNLLTGEVDNLPADGASFQLVLDNLEAQEKAYLELFTGTETVTLQQKQFSYLPLLSMGSHEALLFRFSRHYGFVDNDDLVGEAYMLRIDVIEDNTQVPVLTDAKGRPRPAATGIAYNVPGKLNYAVMHGGEKLAYGTQAAGQFGHVERLPQTQFVDKRNPVKAQFDLLTGSLKVYE